MPNVLVIDDEADVRQLWRDALEDAGCSVSVAENGVRGVKLLESASFDVIVTDILMPEKDGIEIIMEIRKSSPDAKIIAVSGGGAVADTSFLTVASMLGAHRTLQKPVSLHELRDAVQTLTENV